MENQSVQNRRYFVLDDSFLMGPPTDIKRLRSEGGPPGSWDSMCLFLSSCPIVNCSKPLLFQHLTNTVCRPTKHTHTHAATKFSLFPSCFLPVGIRKFPTVLVCNETHPAAEKAADLNEHSLYFCSLFVPRYQQVPVVLVGNKVDLEEEREVSPSEGQALAEDWGCPFMETSAKSKTMVDELFAEIVRQMDFCPLPDRREVCCPACSVQ